MSSRNNQDSSIDHIKTIIDELSSEQPENLDGCIQLLVDSESHGVYNDLILPNDQCDVIMNELKASMRRWIHAFNSQTIFKMPMYAIELYKETMGNEKLRIQSTYQIWSVLLF